MFWWEMIAYFLNILDVGFCLNNLISAMRRQFDFPFSHNQCTFFIKKFRAAHDITNGVLCCCCHEVNGKYLHGYVSCLVLLVLGDAHFHRHQKLHHVKSWSLSFIYIWKKVKTPEHKKSENKSCHAVRRYGCRSFTPSFSTQHITTFLFLLK